MATIKTELQVDQACKNEMLSETYGPKPENQDTIIITKEFRSTSITTLFESSDSFQTFNFCGKKHTSVKHPENLGWRTKVMAWKRKLLSTYIARF